MPTYCYRREDTDELVEITMTMAGMSERETEDEEGNCYVTVDEVRAYRDYAAEFMGGEKPDLWHRGLISDAVGMHPDQVPDAAAFDKAHGVPTDYVTKGEQAGCPIFKSKRHRKRWMDARNKMTVEKSRHIHDLASFD